MPLSEKNASAPMGQEESGETLTIVYPPWKRGMILLLSLILVPIVLAILDEGGIAFDMATFMALVLAAWYLGKGSSPATSPSPPTASSKTACSAGPCCRGTPWS